MFNKDFRAYNEKRMTAEDPKAHMWNARKSFVDYTWCVTASDWMAKLVLLDKHEHSELDRRSGMLTEWRPATPAWCATKAVNDGYDRGREHQEGQDFFANSANSVKRARRARHCSH